VVARAPQDRFADHEDPERRMPPAFFPVALQGGPLVAHGRYRLVPRWLCPLGNAALPRLRTSSLPTCAAAAALVPSPAPASTLLH